MATILTNNFKYKNAEVIRKLFHDVDSRGRLKHNLYLFIARSRAWSNESSPDTPSSLASMQEELDVHNDIIVMKKITASDISLVAPKYVWANNVAYTTWEHNSSTIFSRDGTGGNAQPFYVVTQEADTTWTVWKCLMNAGGVATATEPTIASGLSATHTRGDGTGDGYVWKYMYSVSNAQMTKFSSSVADSSGKLWMPVKTLSHAPSTSDNTSTTSQWDVQRQAIRGGVHLIKPTSAIVAGDATKLIRLVGDGTRFEGTVQTVAISGTTYYYVQVTDPGKNYTYVRRVMKQTTAGGGSSYPSDYTADSNLTAILSPIGGHGWDATKELGGHRMMIHTTLEGDRNFGQDSSNYQHTYGGADGNTYTDYRTVGLMVDPIKSSDVYDDIINGTLKSEVIRTGDRQSAQDATNLARLHYTSETRDSTLTNATDWREKEIMQVNGTGVTSTFTAVGRVVDINTTSKYVYVIPYAGTFSTSQFEPDTGSNVFLNESGTLNANNYFVIDQVKANDILPYSGDIVYLDNRAQIIRDVTRTETIRIVIEF